METTMRRTRCQTGGAVVLALLCGCGGTTRFVHPDADMPYYERVAVIPFESLAQDRLAGEKVTNVFFSELLQRKFDQVLEPGQFANAMLQTRGGTPYASAWSSDDLAKLAKATDVQGVFMGTVREYMMVQNGRDSYPMVALEVRFVDVATGRLVWSASATRSSGPGVPLLGHPQRTIDGLAAETCRDLLRSLPEVKRHAKHAS
jgi:hypothetical protein